MQINTVTAGGIDWVENWRRLVETRRAVIESLGNQGPPQGYWDKRADWFARFSRAMDPANDLLFAMLAETLGKDGTLLDVGAGAGRYALPLARVATRVTAVEPSAGMRERLERGIAEQGVEGIEVIADTWEEARVEPHDVVLCSHVLYPIADVAPFIRKLDEHARRACYLTLRVDQMAPPLGLLWREVWGQERPPEPGLLDLYNLLFGIGIRANARLMPFSGPGPFDDADNAVERLRQLLFLPPDAHEHDDRIRDFVSASMVERDGKLGWPVTQQAAVVWWTKEG